MNIDKKTRENAIYTRSLIEASIDPLVTISLDGKITDVNNATIEATGISRRKLIDSDFSDYFTEPEKARKGYQEVFEKGFVRDYPLAIRHTSGKIIEVLYNARVYKDAQGNILGVFAAARDITERTRAEKELNQHRQHLKELVEKRTKEISQANKFKESIVSTIPSALVVLNRNFEIIDLNMRFFEMFGCAEKEIRGTNFFETVKCKQRGLLAKLKDFYSSKQKEMRFEGVFNFCDANNSKILRFYVSQIEKEKENGNEERILLVIEDITRAKILETRIIQSERLAATGMLTASVAHEINNPLQGMLTHLELMKAGLPKYSKKLKNYNYVKTNINKISAIVGQLLDIYKGVDNKKSSVAINDIILQVSQLIRNRLSIQGVSLKMELNQQLPKISASRQQMHQVILNLFLNALESIEGRGIISISTFRQDKFLKIRVKDTGKGIDKKNMKNIFSPFFSTKRKPGLGLFICQGLIKNHNGDIVVESQKDKGSIFTVTLPIQTEGK